MANLAGILVSLAYVGCVLAAAGMFARRRPGEGSRKLAHIALGGWWFIAMAFFTHPLAAALVPAVFVAVNTIAWRRGLLAAIGRGAGDTPGTVYYACSLLVLALFFFSIGAPYIGALGVLCMALGDGFAAIVGQAVQKARGPGAGGKTLAGSLTMLTLCFATIWGILAVLSRPRALLAAAVLAALATALEYLAPDGLDNLFVPLGVSFGYYLWFTNSPVLRGPLVGLLASGAVVLLAWNRRLLTLPAGLGALAVGSLFYLWGGWPLWALLIWFFSSSNLAAHIVAKRRGPRGPKSSGRRRLVQVLANSLPALACAFGYRITGNPWFMVAAMGALAASTADTWASEVGVYSVRAPVNILNGRPMQRGLSGGVSSLGLWASALASTTVGLLGMLGFWLAGGSIPTGPLAFLLVVACGCIGSLVDSVLGGSIQAKFRCTPGGQLVEKPVGASCTLVSGLRWVNNDLVNLLSGAVTALCALPFALLA